MFSALIVVVPLALYPAYRVIGGRSESDRLWAALPGAALLAQRADVVLMAAIGVDHRACRAAPLRPPLGRVSRPFVVPRQLPVRAGTLSAWRRLAALAYVPLALAFTPWIWSEHGPFSLQLSRPLLYAVYYFAGLGVGAHGLERGLLAPEGMLARRWSVWLVCALASLLLWMGLTGLTLTYATSTPLMLQIAADVSFALAGASGFFFVMAACLRFGAVRSRLFDGLSKNAFGIYLLHYAPLVWLQYALLDVPLFAIAKAMIVFGGTLLLAFAATAAMRFVRFGSRLIGEAPRKTPAKACSLRPPRRLALAGDRAGTANSPAIMIAERAAQMSLADIRN